MSTDISSYIPKLRSLLKNCNKYKDTTYQDIINDDCIVLSICEICHNLLKGNIACEPQYLKTIRPFKHTIRKLARGNVKCTKRVKENRKILMQKGGNIFLATLLPPLISAVGNYFLDKISSNN